MIYRNRVLLSKINVFYKMEKGIVDLITRYVIRCIITTITSSHLYIIYI